MSSTETLQIKNYIGLTGDKPIKFIASDVDGTLVNDAKAIPEDAIEAIRAAREHGIRVAIASGRAWRDERCHRKIVVLALFYVHQWCLRDGQG